MPEKLFISTAIPYVNAKPHIGFALELVQADVAARYRRLQGDDVFFVTGTDDNALKNVKAAEEAGVQVDKFVHDNAKRFKELAKNLNLSNDYFIETSVDPKHLKGAQKLWEEAKKDIYKKKYTGIYCVGCEEFKTEKELVDGKHCAEHPDMELEEVSEENYFFKLSSYQEKLEKLVESDELKIIPESRKNEVLSFIRGGLEDFSISRSVERAHGWGVPVPGDESQIQYVWFDALSNYINALDYAGNGENYKNYWKNGDKIVHVIGKGITRFHAIYWPAMLLAAGAPLPKTIFVHGYITIDSKKISKSIGNVVDPGELIGKYGTDALRYYLARHIHPFEDSDFSEEKFRGAYQADLANGLGNFSSRVTTLASGIGEISDIEATESVSSKIKNAKGKFDEFIGEFKFHEAAAEVWRLIGFGDGYIDENKLWETKNKQIIFDLVVLLDNIALLATPIVPEAASKITEAISWEDEKLTVKKVENLFPRLE
jgi:methionyl-tRNA synthetase